jgi:isopentenyl-diphosphate delta-isomerase
MHMDAQSTETLILVDERGEQIGTASREECHSGGGMRHRAFVVFLFNRRGEVLIQRRSQRKLGGGRWDVSATSHVREGESYQQAIERCLRHELAIERPPHTDRVLSYTYVERFDGYAENEHCALFVGRYDGEIQPNRMEIDGVRWVALRDLERKMESPGESGLTRWFREAMRRFLEHPTSSSARDQES